MAAEAYTAEAWLQRIVHEKKGYIKRLLKSAEFHRYDSKIALSRHLAAPHGHSLNPEKRPSRQKQLPQIRKAIAARIVKGSAPKSRPRGLMPSAPKEFFNNP
jgi:hypothetical protein